MVASSALAIPFSGTVDITRTPGTVGFSGGEYTVTGVAPTVFDSFQTFCLEVPQSVQDNPQTYQLNSGAIAGGNSPGSWGPDGVPGFDPVSIGTAWLYTQFRAGTLGGYDYTLGAGREASAYGLQLAIWFLENEYSSGVLNAEAEAFLALAQGAFAPGTDITLGDFGAQGVYAMNLIGPTGEPSQDMLAIPDGGATLSLLGLGLVGLGMASRRLRRA